jgi:hypothetical protein
MNNHILNNSPQNNYGKYLACNNIYVYIKEMVSKKRNARTSKRKRTNRRKSLKRIQKGGEGDNVLDENQMTEFNNYRSLLDKFITKDNKTYAEALKENLFKDQFDLYNQMLNKSGVEKFTEDDLKLVKTLVYLMIKDDVSERELLFNKNVAGFQTMINNFVMYLINDVPFDEEVNMKLLQGIENKKPYVKVSYDKNTNNFIFDVNELFASIQRELEKEPEEIAKGRIITNKSIKMKSNVKPVLSTSPDGAV